MQRVRLVIEGDLDTGIVRLTGNIDDNVAVHFLLCEARRICERRADARDAEAERMQNGNGSRIQVVGPGAVPGT